jgi:hypothetical protein
VGAAGDVASLRPLVADASVAVAANAAVAIGRLAAATGADVGDALCKAIVDDRALVRANAASSLALLTRAGRAGGACADATLDERLLHNDASEAARASAAAWIGARLAAASAAKGGEGAARLGDLLDRCAASDPSGQVAERCRRARAAAPSATPPRADALVVFVAASDVADPVPHAPYAIERPDGTIHVGTADRRGAVSELFLPRGEVQLRPVGASTSGAAR